MSLPKKSGSFVFSRFFTRRSVKASSSSSVFFSPLDGCGFGVACTLARVSRVAVILMGFGETGGGIFLPVTGSRRIVATELPFAIVSEQPKPTQPLQRFVVNLVKRTVSNKLCHCQWSGMLDIRKWASPPEGVSYSRDAPTECERGCCVKPSLWHSANISYFPFYMMLRYKFKLSF